MNETHPIPKVARTAFALTLQNFQKAVNELGRQTVEALGLNPDDNYNVNFDTGIITREVPDIAPQPDPAVGA